MRRCEPRKNSSQCAAKKISEARVLRGGFPCGSVSGLRAACREPENTGGFQWKGRPLLGGKVHASVSTMAVAIVDFPLPSAPHRTTHSPGGRKYRRRTRAPFL